MFYLLFLMINISILFYSIILSFTVIPSKFVTSNRIDLLYKIVQDCNLSISETLQVLHNGKFVPFVEKKVDISITISSSSSNNKYPPLVILIPLRFGSFSSQDSPITSKTIRTERIFPKSNGP